MELHLGAVCTLEDKEEFCFVLVFCDNYWCYAVYIRWYGRMHGERRTRGAPMPASLMYPDAALPLVRSPLVQAATLVDVAATTPRRCTRSGEFVICDNDQCCAEYIRWCRRIHGERRI